MKKELKMHCLIGSCLSLLVAPADVLTAGRRCAKRGGSSGTALLPGSEQEAVESADVPGCRGGGHSPARHTEPGGYRCMMVSRGLMAVNVWRWDQWHSCVICSRRTSWRTTRLNPFSAAMQSTQKNTSHPSFCSSAKVKIRRSQIFIFLTVRPWRWVIITPLRASRSFLPGTVFESSARFRFYKRWHLSLQAEQICDDIAQVVSDSSKSRTKRPEALRYSDCPGPKSGLNIF